MNMNSMTKTSSFESNGSIFFILKVLPDGENILASPTEIPSQNVSICSGQEIRKLVNLPSKFGIWLNINDDVRR
jgi:hypothetical protein